MLGRLCGPSPWLQVWQVIFTVMTVDALLRSAGFAAKCVVLLAHPSAPEENFRRRSQVDSSQGPVPRTAARSVQSSCFVGGSEPVCGIWPRCSAWWSRLC